MVRRGTRVNATLHARPCGSATRTHVSACMARRWCGRRGGATWHEIFGLADDGPTGIVGPGKIVGAVTQRR